WSSFTFSLPTSSASFSIDASPFQSSMILDVFFLTMDAISSNPLYKTSILLLTKSFVPRKRSQYRSRTKKGASSLKIFLN
ncbi:hypothetical protein MUP00_08330, partial [Candidatus Bathyarchaeota archaeon]|nr:hypothetical protein [Candidatus Bathyarchaeota archaeon]